MAFQASLTESKSRKIFLVFFFLASLTPILIAIFIMYHYIFPCLSLKEYDSLSDTLFLGLCAMVLFPFISFFLIYRWFDSLENVTSEIVSKSTEVASGQKEFC